MTQYLSGSETTRPERLLDTIIVRSAYQTPLISRLPHAATSHVITEWPLDEPFTTTDAVRSISGPHNDSRREGSDFIFRTPHYPYRAKTICEIKHHGMEMSGTDRAARLAGVDNPWDYRSGQLFTTHLNSIDNVGMYGMGSPETSGASDERRTAGLICNAAWTGLERAHGTATEVQDQYGVSLPSTMFSQFYDANHSPITLDMLTRSLITPLLKAGADLETSTWNFMCGYEVMQRVARFLIADGGVPINERQRSADDAMGNDYLNVFKLATGHTVTFRTNRWLSEDAQTYTVDNTDYTPGAPTSPGSQTRTFYGNQTIIGYEPGSVRWLWYREPGFVDADDGDGDYSRIACLSEFALQVDHPLCVGGIANCLA